MLRTVLKLIASPLVHSDEARPMDAIVVLGYPANADGTASPFQRMGVEYGVALFNQGFGRKLIFSGAAIQNEFAEADVMAEYALTLGVAAADIIRETQSRNTITNIACVRPILQQNEVHRALYVTIPTHTKRTRRLLANEAYESMVVAAPLPANISRILLMRRLVWEYGGCVFDWLNTSSPKWLRPAFSSTI